MFTLNDKRVNIYAPYTSPEGVTFADLTRPDVREMVGVVEIPDPVPPVDYSEETYYRTEQQDAPYLVFTRKSDEQLAQLRRSKIDAKLAGVRDTREGILNRLAGIAFAAQLTGDTATTGAYILVRQGLLDITKGVGEDPALVGSMVLARYAGVVALCTPQMVSAFAEVDL